MKPFNTNAHVCRESGKNYKQIQIIETRIFNESNWKMLTLETEPTTWLNINTALFIFSSGLFVFSSFSVQMNWQEHILRNMASFANMAIVWCAQSQTCARFVTFLIEHAFGSLSASWIWLHQPVPLTVLYFE